MSSRNLRTANYSDKARRDLGDAVATARRAAGFRWRTDFARAHQEVSVSSLKLVEQAKPVVGVTALQAIGRALGQHFSNWTEDTPRRILEGSPPPEIAVAAQPDPHISPVLTSHPDDPEFWVALASEVPRERFDELWRIYLDRRRLLAERDRPNRSGLLDPSRSEDDRE